MKTIFAAAVAMLIAATCLAAPAGQEVTDERVKALESRLALAEARLTAYEVKFQNRTSELTERVAKLEAANATMLRGLTDNGPGTSAWDAPEVPEEVKPDLRALMSYSFNDGTRNARLAALSSIGKQGTKAVGAVPTVVATLQNDEDWNIRRLAAETLPLICKGVRGEMTRVAFMALQDSRANDKEPRVRDAATESLRQLLGR